MDSSHYADKTKDELIKIACLYHNVPLAQAVAMSHQQLVDIIVNAKPLNKGGQLQRKRAALEINMSAKGSAIKPDVKSEAKPNASNVEALPTAPKRRGRPRKVVENTPMTKPAQMITMTPMVQSFQPVVENEEPVAPRRKLGRPKGSKNKPKYAQNSPVVVKSLDEILLEKEKASAVSKPTAVIPTIAPFMVKPLPFNEKIEPVVKVEKSVEKEKPHKQNPSTPQPQGKKNKKEWREQGKHNAPFAQEQQVNDAKVTAPNDKTQGEPVTGILELMPEGFGFLRRENYLQGGGDVYIAPQYIRRYGLRNGDQVTGPCRPQRGEQDRYPAIYYIKEVNGKSPEKMMRRPHFDKLTPIYPDERYVLETTREELSTRIIDLMAPIGKGQRGMIVSPPKAGKTVLLQKIANAISINNPEAKLIVLLIDERPEEVTDMQRSIKGEVVYSTFDKTPENHVKVTELVLDRAERLVELGEDVIILLDSITRMGRAYNLSITPTGRTLSGGLDPGALYGPKRFFGAARNIEGGGSLTIVATALIDTGSRMDEVIFEEFKGTGNMEVYLDRKLSEKRIFPAIDINRSGTRREDLLLTKKQLDAVWTIRKAMSQLDTGAVTEATINVLTKTTSNEQFIASINSSLNDKANLEAMRNLKSGYNHNNNNLTGGNNGGGQGYTNRR